MRLRGYTLLLFFATAAFAQNEEKLASPPEPVSVTVPITLDHNRITVDVDLLQPDRVKQRVHGVVDNGNSELWMSRSVATAMGLSVSCDGQECHARAPTSMVSLEILIGGLKVFLATTADVRVPAGNGVGLTPGMKAEINIPSSILQKYDVLIDFPEHKLTLAQPGKVKFDGVKAKMLLDKVTGFVSVPSVIDSKKYNLPLDLGSSMSVVNAALFDKLESAHPGWPHMTGAIGPANDWGDSEEPKQKLMRIERLQFGPVYLTNVACMRLGAEKKNSLGENRLPAAVGLIGSEALLNYRVGIDYAHSAIYFEIGRTFNFPDFDVVGLILLLENDGQFSIVGVADYDGKPSVPQGETGVQAGDHLVAVNGIPTAGSSLGQVWAMLGGAPGQERKLTIERTGKQMGVTAIVQHFLGDERK